jgi:hypothetical protein
MEMLSEQEKRNVFLIKREFIRELDHGLGKIKKLISRIYSSLLLNIPSNIFYYLYFRGGVRNNVITQIKLSLRMAIEYDGNNIDALIEQYKQVYLQNDLISLHCRKEHPIYTELQEITINNLFSRVPILHALIHSSGQTYDDLVKNAFTSKEEVRRVLEVQLIFMDQWIDLLANNKDALIAPRVLSIEVPIAKENIFKIILETYEYGMERLEKKLEQFFPPDTS